MKNLLISTLFLALSVEGQSQRDDLLGMYKHLLGSNSYSLELHYSLYLDKDMTKPLQERRTTMMRQGDNLHVSQNSGIEIVETSHYGFMIDHRGKKLSAKRYEGVAADRSEARRLLLDAIGKNYIDSLIGHFSEIRLVSEKGSVRRYECTGQPDLPIEVMWLEVDKTQKIYKSMTVRYREKQKFKTVDDQLHSVTLKIEYSGFSSSPKCSAQLFDPGTYVRDNAKGIQGPSAKFKTYAYRNLSH